MSLCILRGASLINERIACTKLSPMRLIHLHRKPLFESFSSLRSTPVTSIVGHVTTGPVKAAPVFCTLHKLLHYSPMASTRCCNSPIFGAYTNSDQTLKKTGGIRNMSSNAYDVPADKKINSEAFADLLKNQDIRLIDARGRSEVEQTGLLPKTVNIPAGEIATVMKMPDAKFKYKYGFDKPQKHEILVFVCSTGVRSSKALKTALDMGYNSFSTSTRSNETQQTPEASVKIGPERHLDYKALARLMERKEVVLIDVREPHELQETGELPGSINVPLNELKVALQELTDAEFQKKYGAKKPGLNAPLVFSCRSGARSLKALQLALELGYMKAKHYRGGFLDWKENIKLKNK